MFNRASEECVFLEIQKGKLFSLQTLLPEITTRELPPSDRSTTHVPLCQHFCACAYSQARDVPGLELTDSIVLKPKINNTRKLPNIEVKKLSSWIMIESIIVLIGTHYDALEDQETYLALNSGRRTLADDIWQLPIQIPERFLTQIQIQMLW